MVKILNSISLFLIFLFSPFAGFAADEVTATSAGELSNKDLPWILRFLQLGKSPYTTINPANELSRDVQSLYGLFAWVGVGILSLVTLIFIVVVVRFHEKKNPQPKDIHGNFFLELSWTIIPIIILIVIGVPTIRLLFKIDEIPSFSKGSYSYASRPDGKYKEVLDVTAVAHQWWWEFEYTGLRTIDPKTGAETIIPLKRVTANVPVFPVGVPVNLTLISEDVIHSLWLPRIAGKKDVMPGRMVDGFGWLFEEKGIYAGECALYCGAAHASMKFDAHAVSREDFETWLNWGQGDLIVKSAAAQRGSVYFKNCVGCHTLNGVRGFESRAERFDQAMKDYNSANENYKKDLQAYLASVKDSTKASEFSWRREEDSDPLRPHKPLIPRLYEGNFRTIAPDLTDLRFRPLLFAGIRKNSPESLKEWIRDPKSIKLDIEGSVAIRMPAYKHLFNDQVIDDIVAFLLSVEYSKSKAYSFMQEMSGETPKNIVENMNMNHQMLGQQNLGMDKTNKEMNQMEHNHN